jgi:hypothetical protein
MIYEKQVRPDLTLLVGQNALSLFDYYGVDELHGLNKKDCIKRINEGGTYFDGFQNLIPYEKDQYYLFINNSSLTENELDNFGLIFHESTHYQFEKYYDSLKENEEQLITDAEILAKEIYETIRQIS